MSPIFLGYLYVIFDSLMSQFEIILFNMFLKLQFSKKAD